MQPEQFFMKVRLTFARQIRPNHRRKTDDMPTRAIRSIPYFFVQSLPAPRLKNGLECVQHVKPSVKGIMLSEHRQDGKYDKGARSIASPASFGNNQPQKKNLPLSCVEQRAWAQATLSSADDYEINVQSLAETYCTNLAVLAPEERTRFSGSNVVVGRPRIWWTRTPLVWVRRAISVSPGE